MLNYSSCNYIHRICLQNKLEGFDHCIRHILYDKSAAFKQCSFVHPQSHKRCPNAARKTERKDAVCPWHIKKFFIKRKQLQNSLEEKSITKTSIIQQLFRDLEHYCPNLEHDKNRLNSDWVKQEGDSITASNYLRKKIAESKLNINESGSDDELNDPYVEDTFRSDLIDSDSESVGSDQEEPLKHAGVYTAEEVSLILRDKMLKLQSLYINELKYLQHMLKEKYKKYISNIKNEQGFFQFNPFKLSNRTLPTDDYKKLKTLMRYHRYHGSEALLKMKVKEKRKALASALAKNNETCTNSLPQCIYEKDDEKCTKRSMPLTHYCKLHILYDVDQILFRPCAAGDPPCLNPVISFQKGNTCILHEEQKEIKDFNILEDEDNNRNVDIGINNINVPEFLAGNPLGIGSVESGSLFGLEQFNQLENN